MASRPRRWQWHQWPFRSMTLVALQPSRRRGRRPRHRRSLRPSRITDANRMLVVNTGKPVIGRTSTGWKSGRCSPSMGFRPGCPFFISVPRSRSSTGGARSLRMHARARVATGWPSKGIATPFISGASRADLTLASLQAVRQLLGSSGNLIHSHRLLWISAMPRRMAQQCVGIHLRAWAPGRRVSRRMQHLAVTPSTRLHCRQGRPRPPPPR
mmetsp:Transcript_17873/g.62709  ORF Transcript_17873/g.62709 Transcript_17873/m.62709 type:complete len:212 (+) Transcript_17873:797-1432(+)